MRSVEWIRQLLIGFLEKIAFAGVLRANGLAGPRVAVPEAFLEVSRHAIRRLRKRGADWAIGDYLEFGVGRGDFMVGMLHALRAEGLSHVRLFGFDSFQERSEPAVETSSRPGAFDPSLAATQSFLARAGANRDQIRLVKGGFKDTLTPERRESLGTNCVSLIRIACDYSSAREALHFAEPLIRDQAILILDDYDTYEKGGQRRAFLEFLNEFSHFATEELPSYAPRARLVLLTRRSVAQGPEETT